MQRPLSVVAGLCLLASASLFAQQAQSPTTGSAGRSPGGDWLPPESDFRVVVLDQDREVDGAPGDTLVDPMELSVAPDGRVFWAERAGVVKVWNPSDKKTVEIARLPVFTGLEEGLLGITLDPDFGRNGWLYLNRSMPETFNDGQGKAGKIRVARFTVKGDALDLASETVILEMTVQREQCCHVGGSLAFDSKGNLYVSIGDNTNPFDSDGFSPNDPRPGRYPWDAARSAGNANSLVGKILRIKPRAGGGYDIPEGNLFPQGTTGTRPEVYVMGNRNPFRISVDPRNGYLYWGEVGPDAGSPNPKRGPAGFDEVNQARGPGFFGWPFFVGDNKPYARIDFVARQKHIDAREAREAAKKAGKPESEWPPAPAPWEIDNPPLFDPAHPVNDSPNNTGIRDLPPAQPAFIYYPAAPSTRFPVVGSGGRTAMAGPVYYFDPANASPNRLPKVFDHTLFIYEWTRNWIIAVKLDANDRIARGSDGKMMMQRFLPGTTIKRPMDMEMGPDGCLYLIEFGKDWGNNKDTRILKIEYTGGQ